MTELRLSRLIGRPVVSSDGRRVGRVRDLGVSLSSGAPEVGLLGVGGRRRLTHLVPWDLVASQDDLGIGLAADVDDLERFRLEDGVDDALGEDELLLARDVLDTQIVDLAGRRLSRVADVLLTDRAGDLDVVAVDVGAGALLGRLGLGLWGHLLAPVLVPWADVHLASVRGQPVQLATSTEGLLRLDPAGLAELLARLPTAPAADVIRAVGPTRSVMALDASHHQLRHRLLRALAPGDREQLLDAAPEVVSTPAS